MISLWFEENPTYFRIGRWIDGVVVALWFFFMVPL